MTALDAVAAPPADWAIEMLDIHKRFGTVVANQGVTLRVRRATIHGLVGENGAGKSTLMSILYGFYRPDAGHIRLHGRDIPIGSTHDAIAAGVGMVHQHFMLVDTLSALDNILLGSEGHFDLHTARHRARQRLLDLMHDSGMHVPLDAQVGDLSVGDRQRLEILKALWRGARILILDEPTAVLTPQEAEQLFAVLRRLRARGTTVLIITHKLKEVLALCDEVTVMRGGQVVLQASIAEVDMQRLAQAMVGRSVHLGRTTAQPRRSTASEVRLEARDLHAIDHMGVTRLHHVSLRLHAGEIVGLAGVAGNGQSELLAALSGLKAPQTGTLTIGTHTFTPERWLDPVTARHLRIAHVPEDRHAQGMVMPFAAWESMALGYEAWPRCSRRGWMQRRTLQRDTAQWMERFDVRPRNIHLRCALFSGGNQQKQVLARELAQQPRILLIGQPTRGVDIGAIEFIHNQLRALRDAGCSILLVSTELDEILALADRVLVMHHGSIVGELPIEACDETRLGMLMAGQAVSHPGGTV